MKILIDATGITEKTTGAGQYSLQLLMALSEIDNKNEYFVVLQRGLKKSHPIFTLANNPNFFLVKADIPSVGPEKQIYFPAIVKLNCIKCDLLHSLNSELPLFCNIKSIVTIYDLKYLKYPEFLSGLSKIKSRYLKYIMKAGARRSIKVIAISKSTKRDIVNLLGIEEDKIKVIYLASNLDLYPQQSVRCNIEIIKKYAIKKPYLLYVGEKRPHKNLEGLIEAFAIFKQKYDRWNTYLVITGKKYSKYKDYINKAEKLKVMSSLVLTGFIPDEHLKAIYSEAEMLLLVSLYEGFGVPILEAMECRTPIITSNVSSMPEVAGDAAFLVNPQNPQEIAEKTNRIMSSKELRKQLIEKGAKRIKRFSWKETARQTLQIYEYVHNQ